jgi:hypothetical protein
MRRAAGEAGEPQYGSLTWATRAALQLAAGKVLHSAERKKLFLQTLVLLITGNAAKHTDPAILMQILATVRAWLLQPLLQPPSGPGRPAEAVSLTEKAREPSPFCVPYAVIKRSVCLPPDAGRLWAWAQHVCLLCGR